MSDDVIDPAVDASAPIKALYATVDPALAQPRQVIDLQGALLDLAVARALGIPAVLRQVTTATTSFLECRIQDEDGTLRQRAVTSRSWAQGGTLAEEHWPAIVAQLRVWLGDRWAETGDMMRGEAVLKWFMRALVASKLGEVVVL